MKRHVALTALLLAAAGTLAVIQRPRVVEAGLPEPDSVPEAAIEAMRQGRYLRASLILREYLASAPDTSQAIALFTAEAEAGWGDWERVERLLAGRTWLDSLSSGHGWYLLGRAQLALGRHAESARSIARYLELVDGIEERDRAIAELRLAAALRASEQYAEALAAYDRALQRLPHIGDWILVNSAAAAAQGGDTAQVAQRLVRIDSTIARDWGWRLRLRAALEASDTTLALALAESFTADPTLTPGRRGEAWVRVGEMRMARGDTSGARAAFIRSMEVAPSGAGIEGARIMSDMQPLSPAERLLIGRVYLRHGNSERGIAGIRAYLDAGAGSASERASLRAELGRLLFNARRYAEAEKFLLETASNASSQASAANALFMAARSQYRDGRQTLARQTFLRVAERYPDHDAAAQAMYILADLDHDDNNIDRARERYRRTIALPSDVDEVGLAHMRLGNLAFIDGDFAGALQAYDNYRRNYPQGQRYQQATYWSALALSRMGNDSASRARLETAFSRDPFAYYGGRAGALIGRTLENARLGSSPEPDAALSGQVARALGRFDLLREIGWSDAASFELERARTEILRTQGADYALAEALIARGYAAAATSLAYEIRRREGAWNLRLLRILYPFPHQNLIVAEAAERNIDPYLAAALIRQESSFNPNAVSGAGAIGLMQVMPATGQTLARTLDLRRFSPELLRHAEVNIHLGMAHLSDALRTYSGRLPVVLAAYNAGSGRIDRWREFPEFDDDDLFTERIPFEETRDYVKIVQNNARMYRALYGGG